jgi:GT2 family glycosyltransferase
MTLREDRSMSPGPATIALIGLGDASAVDGVEALRTGGPLTAADLTAVSADHLLLCPSGVSLLPEALPAIREMLLHAPDVELAYFDSFSDPAGREAGAPVPGAGWGRSMGSPAGREGDADRAEAHHRPGFSPDRLRVQMYLGEVLLVRRGVLAAQLAAGDGIDLPPTLSQVNALAARCGTIAHLPRLLYRVDGETGRAGGGGPVDLVDAEPHDARLAAERFPGRAVPRGGDGRTIDLRPDIGQAPLVSIVMPTVGADRVVDGRSTTLCLRAVDRVVARTTYRPYELVVVLTPGAPGDLPNRILGTVEANDPDRRPAVRFCRDEREFNFSNACNRGATMASGSVLVFLNDDTAVRTADWLERLVMYATRPEIGVVGARLLYGDGTVQHTGIWTRGGHPAHRYEGFPADHRGHLDSLTVAQNCLAVTGACLAVEAAKFREAGGFCPEFPSSYNDVDLCLKLGDLGYRTVVDPGTVLTHYEASSRDPVIEDWELALLHRRWRRLLIDDPFDNPNHLAPQAEEFPPPDPVITLHRQRKADAGALGGHPPRLWYRPGPDAAGDGPPADPTEVAHHVA